MNHDGWREWSEVDGIRLINGDCLDVMPTLEAGSVDLILSDLPYGTTACKWDTVIPFEPLWACFKRVLKPKGAVVLTASQPFTSMLVMSNRDWFKYCWVWVKNRATGFQHAKNAPLKSHEDVLVFSPGVVNHENMTANRMNYYPQFSAGKPYRKVHRSPNATGGGMHHASKANLAYVGSVSDNLGIRYPTTILDYTEHNGGNVHPTQKPVALFEYLIRTYSNEGETILDATFGSGTTPVACVNTGRKFVGSEKDTEHGYFDMSIRRVREAAAKTALFA